MCPIHLVPTVLRWECRAENGEIRGPRIRLNIHPILCGEPSPNTLWPGKLSHRRGGPCSLGDRPVHSTEADDATSSMQLICEKDRARGSAADVRAIRPYMARALSLYFMKRVEGKPTSVGCGRNRLLKDDRTSDPRVSIDLLTAPQREQPRRDVVPKGTKWLVHVPRQIRE